MSTPQEKSVAMLEVMRIASETNRKLHIKIKDLEKERDVYRSALEKYTPNNGGMVCVPKDYAGQALAQYPKEGENEDS